VPRRTANATISARVPSFTALSFGVSGKWQSGIKGAEDYTFHPVYQDSYALVNAFAAWDIQPNITVRGNVNNISDEKYITSLYNVGYYGAPRNYSVSVDWRF
jgi:outer membrane receptor for ferric coprogen and ferric-rhodotorulic acid